MKKAYFYDFGLLEWIEPADYYAGRWHYYGTASSTEGEIYDIVLTSDGCEFRYTII